MEATLSAILSSYYLVPKQTLINVLNVVVPAGVGFLVIRMSIKYAQEYFRQFSGFGKNKVYRGYGSTSTVAMDKDFDAYKKDGGHKDYHEFGRDYNSSEF